MGEFSVGDRVVLTVDNPDGNEALTAGMCGTVRNISPNGADNLIGVIWDDFSEGWSIYIELPRSLRHSGWLVKTSEIELVSDDELENEFIIDDAAFAVFADALS